MAKGAGSFRRPASSGPFPTSPLPRRERPATTALDQTRGKLLLDLGLAAAAKLGAPALVKGLGAKLAASGIIGAGDKAAAEGSENAAASVIQRGGAHRNVKGIPGYESHHMPARSASPLSANDGPAIAIQSSDHPLTASWGPTGKAFRRAQAELIKRGKFRAAQQMDIDDIRAKFGNKYDDAIRQMLEYTARLGF